MQIESDIPLPPKFSERRRWADVAEKMKPGDSIAVENESEAGSLRYALKRRGYACATRKAKGEWRVWRVE